MNKAAPWSVKGVDFDAREAARDAARRSGMSLGEWLNDAISEQARERGVAFDEVDEEGRLEAVTARLATLSERGRRQARRFDASDDEDTPRRRVAVERPRADIRETSYESRRRDRYDAPEPLTPGNPESLLDAAIRAYERGASRGERANEAYSHVASKLAEIERRLSRPGGDDAPRQGARSNPTEIEKIARLEAKLESLSREKDAEKSERSLRGLERRLEEMAERMTAGRAPSANAPAQDFGRLESKLNRLIEKFEATPPLANETQPVQAAWRDQARAAPQTPSRLNEAISQISRRQRDLDDSPRPTPRRLPDNPARAQRPAAEVRSGHRDDFDDLPRRIDDARRAMATQGFERPTAASSPDPAVEALKAEVAKLNRRMEETQSAVVARLDAQPRDAARSAAASDPAIAALRLEIAEMGRRLPASPDGGAPELSALRARLDDISRSLGQLAPRDSVASLEGAVRALGASVDQSLRNGSQQALLRPIAELTADLRGAISDLAPARGFETVERAIRDLGSKIEQSRAAVADPAAVADIRSQTGEIRALLQRAAARPPAGESVERQLARLADRLEGRAAPAGDDDAPRGMTELLAKRIDDLAAKIDEAVSQSSATDQLDDLARRIDNVHHSIAEKLASPLPSVDTSALEGLMRDIAAKLERPVAFALADPVDTSRFEDMLRQVGARLEDPAQAADPRAMDALRTEVSSMSKAIEGLAKSSVDADVFEDIRHDMARFAERLDAAPAGGGDARADETRGLLRALADRMDRLEQGSRAISSMHDAIADLANRIDDNRHSVADVAENAARSAAQITVVEALARLRPAEAADSTLPHEIADIRSMQERSDQRTYSTLNAVHETLEKVVDRIAVLEDEVGETRAPRMLAVGDAPVFAPATPPPAAPAAPKPAPPTPVVMPRGGNEFDPPDFQSSSAGVHLGGFPTGPELGFADGADAGAAPEIQPRFPDAQPSPEQSPPEERKRWLDAARRQAQANAASAKDAAAPEPRVSPRENMAIEVKHAEARARAQAAHKAWAAGGAGDDSMARAGVANGGARKIFGLAAPPKKALLIVPVLALLLLGGFLLSRGRLGASPQPEISAIADPTAAAPAAPAPIAPQPAVPSPPPAEKAPPRRAGGASLENPVVPSSGTSAGNAIASDPSPVGSINGSPNTQNAAPSSGLQAAADTGSASAQYELGARYADGRNVARDPRRAIEWFTKAASQNLAPAAYRLGSLYERGTGTDRDLAKARSWYMKAADAGNIRAMHNIAVLSAEGVDGKPDYAAASSWFRKASEYGVRDSQYNLAILYARGLGVEQSLSLSWAWFGIAAAQGDTDAAKKQDDVGARLDTKQMADAKAFVAAFRPKPTDKAANEVASPPGGWDAPTARMEPKRDLYPPAPTPALKAPPKRKTTST